jgi:hypothetical protein
MAKKAKPIRLNPKQELFCQLFVRDSRFIGNATRAYLQAYELPDERYESALRCSSRLLIKVDIRKRVNELLDACLQHEIVDRELAFVILQSKDLAAKVAAIKEYNRLRDRAADHIEGNFTFTWGDPSSAS